MFFPQFISIKFRWLLTPYSSTNPDGFTDSKLQSTPNLSSLYILIHILVGKIAKQYPQFRIDLTCASFQMFSASGGRRASLRFATSGPEAQFFSVGNRVGVEFRQLRGDDGDMMGNKWGYVMICTHIQPYIYIYIYVFLFYVYCTCAYIYILYVCFIYIYTLMIL